jgi:hypothetical protein
MVRIVEGLPDEFNAHKIYSQLSNTFLPDNNINDDNDDDDDGNNNNHNPPTH